MGRNRFGRGGRGGSRDDNRKRGRVFRKDFRESRPNEWKRPRSDGNDPSGGNWETYQRTNDAFESYYKMQKIVPEGEWDDFISILKVSLPTTFRINGSGKFAFEIRDQIQKEFCDFMNQGVEVEGEIIDPPSPIEWYPNRLAWHFNFSRNQLRKFPVLEKIFDFMKRENEIGSITRQEAVSMIPPLVLGVEKHHRILDMCAAPGSKTFQLLEMIHDNEQKSNVPKGLVIANDADAQRCHLLIHQIQRMYSANVIVTNHEGQFFPSLHLPSKTSLSTHEIQSQGVTVDEGRNGEGKQKNEYLNDVIDDKDEEYLFDRILCDVPCSGDGTLRKAPDIWKKWSVGNGNGLHPLQVKIAMRGLNLLKVGGILVYSTCSLNPIENEAVVNEILRQCKGSVELLNGFEFLPELKKTHGLKTWVVSDKKSWYTSYSQVKNIKNSKLCSSMFPLGDDTDEANSKQENVPNSNIANDGNPEKRDELEAKKEKESESKTENGESEERDLNDSEIIGVEKTSTERERNEENGKNDELQGDVNASINIETNEELKSEYSLFPLENCIRILPHHQNTGGFFISILKKIAPLPIDEKERQKQKERRLQGKSNFEKLNTEKTDSSISLSVEELPIDVKENELSETKEKNVIDDANADDNDKNDHDGIDVDNSSNPDELIIGGDSVVQGNDGLQESEKIGIKNDEKEFHHETEGRNTNENKIKRVQRQGRFTGVDPILYLQKDEILNCIIDYYGIKEEFFSSGKLIVRSQDTVGMKRIYFVSNSSANVISRNFLTGERLKILSAGLKVFERQSIRDANVSCLFRLTSQGIILLYPYITKQIVRCGASDFYRVVKQGSAQISSFERKSTLDQISSSQNGCLVLCLDDTENDDDDGNDGSKERPFPKAVIPVWKGKSTLSLLINKLEATQLIHRLGLGSDETITEPEAIQPEETESEAIEPENHELLNN